MTHLLASVEVEASAAGATRVVAVNLVVGERAGVVYDSLRFYFDILTPGTVADGARLNVRRLPMRFRCARCADDYSPGPADFDCPRCGEVGGLTDGATDLLIESLEVES